MSKRSRSPETAAGANPPNKRKSRFGDVAPPSDIDAATLKAQIDARVAAISKKLESDAFNATASAKIVSAGASASLAQQQALALQAQVAAQLASVSSLLNKTQLPNTAKKAAVYELRLDDQGREIDEHGNLIQLVAPQVKTLSANLQVEKAAVAAKRKKENPYLAHRLAPEKEEGVSTIDGVSSVTDASVVVSTGIDARLAQRSKRREAHLKRALHFVEEGTYTEEEEKLQQKEERRALYSGRKAPEKLIADIAEAAKAAADDLLTRVPAPVDIDKAVPAMEWWDEMYLPKNGIELGETTISLAQMKKQLQLATAASNSTSTSSSFTDQHITVSDGKESSLFQPRVAAVTASAPAQSSSSGNGGKSGDPSTGFPLGIEDFYKLLALVNSKTYQYVQHPVPPTPLGGESVVDAPLPLYLTVKERKRIRKKAREEREQEKRDKQMMGLIPAAEPKFKLSNFMKVLGDQAVADPSKIEQKVIEQMRNREMNHEMRNQARKLTPLERKEKEKKKNIEDTSKLVHVAVFRVCDLSDKKKQFKVDATAQRHHLTGTVLISTNAEVPTSLVVVEGGPRGIRIFSKLMSRRIPWKVPSEAYTNPKNALAAIAAYGNSGEGEEEGGDDGAGNDDDDYGGETSNAAAIAASMATEPLIDPATNDCFLLWEGMLAKRLFPSFKFQVSCFIYLYVYNVLHIGICLTFFVLYFLHLLN